MRRCQLPADSLPALCSLTHSSDNFSGLFSEALWLQCGQPSLSPASASYCRSVGLRGGTPCQGLRVRLTDLLRGLGSGAHWLGDSERVT